jgi:hypothetical protein
MFNLLLMWAVVACGIIKFWGKLDLNSIAIRVFLSGLAGVAAGAIVLPIMLVRPDNLLTAILSVLGGAPFLAFVGAVIASPLVAIAILTAVIFRKSIEKRLLLWCCIAPFAVWSFVWIFEAIHRNNFHTIQGFLTQLYYTSTANENLLFLFCPMGASLVFFLLSRRPTRSRKSCIATPCSELDGV